MSLNVLMPSEPGQGLDDTIVDETPSQPWGVDERIANAGPEQARPHRSPADFNTVEMRFYQGALEERDLATSIRALPPELRPGVLRRTVPKAEPDQTNGDLYLIGALLAALGLGAGVLIALLS
jgi:hypothetical protein